jgi:acyl transferase domain-containing protein
MKTVFMFSGQGSQYFQMGADLMEKSEVFRAEMQRLDAIASPLVGCSLCALLYQSGRFKGEPFERLLHTHSAIYMVEIALARALTAAGVIPDLVLGASLGTFAATVVAGLVSSDDALVALIDQARAIEAHCPPGGMIAVLAAPEAFEESELAGLCEISSHNFATHFVLSAPACHLPLIEEKLSRREIMFQRLPVAFAFHSRWIEEGSEQIQQATRSLASTGATLPLACCATGGLIEEIGAQHFWQVVRRPMQFKILIEELERSGGHRFVDLGPAGTLAAFLRYLLPPGSASQAAGIMSPYGREYARFEALVTSHAQRPSALHRARDALE